MSTAICKQKTSRCVAGKLNAVAILRVVIFLICSAFLISVSYANDKSADYQQLISKLSASSTPKLRVIAQLNNSLPDGFKAQHSSAINAAQALVINALNSTSYSNLKTFRHLPMLAVQVNRQALKTLYENHQVVRLFEDKAEKPDQLNLINRPQLFDSSDTVQASYLWDKGILGTEQVVAVLDTGVRTSHEMFTGKVLLEACFSSNNFPNVQSACPNGAQTQTGFGSASPPFGVDGYFHGTHVAGIAVGDRKQFPVNGDGVAKGARLIAINVFSRFNTASDCEGTAPCLLAYISDQIRGLEYVYGLRNSYNIAAINMSLGGGQYTSHCDANESRTAIVTQLYLAGIPVVASSGNSSYSNAVGAPACISRVISVGSTRYDGASISDFSNSAAILDLLAPGGSIISADANNSTGYVLLSGTSMAAPHVAGAFALINSAGNGHSAVQIEAALKSKGRSMLDSRNGIRRSLIQLFDTYRFLNPSTASIIPIISILMFDD